MLLLTEISNKANTYKNGASERSPVFYLTKQNKIIAYHNTLSYVKNIEKLLKKLIM